MSTLIATLNDVDLIADAADYGTGFETGSSSTDIDSGEEVFSNEGFLPSGFHLETLRMTRNDPDSGHGFAAKVKAYDGNVTADEHAAEQQMALSSAPAFVIANVLVNGFERHDGTRAPGLIDHLDGTTSVKGVRLVKDTVAQIVGLDQAVVLGERKFVQIVRDTVTRVLSDVGAANISRDEVSALLEVLPAARLSTVDGALVLDDPAAKLRKVLDNSLMSDFEARAAVRAQREANAAHSAQIARERTKRNKASRSSRSNSNNTLRPGAIGSVVTTTGRRNRRRVA